MRKLPVFYDPDKGRRKHLLRFAAAFSVVAVFSFACVVLGAIAEPVLPLPKELSATSETRHLRTLRHEVEKRAKALYKNEKPVVPASVTDSVNLSAFYVEWDDAAFQSLKTNSNKISKLSAEELSFDLSGSVALRNPDKFERTKAFLKSSGQEIEFLPLVSNFEESSGAWSSDKLSKTLGNPATRTALVENLAAFADKHGADGVNVDFEEIPDASYSDYYAFLKELSARFHADKLRVEVEAPVGNDSYDFTKVAPSVDSIVLMEYDEHWLTGKAGPVSSQDWYKNHLVAILKTVPASKLTVAIGNYGYDWKTGSGKTEATAVTFQEALTTARESETVPEFDADSLNPHYSYEDEKGVTHEVWYLDAVTAFNQISAARELGIDDFALWRMGSEDPSFWKLLEGNHFEDGKAPTELSAFGYGYDIDYEGTGEFYRVTGTPKDGSRDLAFENGVVTDEKLKDFPLPYVITRNGAKDAKKIALTFDDGPDPEYTPKILDALKTAGAKATFFVIGEGVESHPEIVRRIMDEGHSIGNHSFTHPDISKIGKMRTDVELNLTQRLIESVTGHSTLLFRPPYGEDVEPETPDQVEPLTRSNELGYVTVGMKIDPNDWRSPPADEIVRRVVEGAKEERGNVVLLHDSGGDRSSTVAAIPGIVAGLKAAGFEIVPISELVGVPPDELMPKIRNSDMALEAGDSVFFPLVRAIGLAVYFVFVLYLAVGMFRLASVIAFAIVQKYRERHRHFDEDFLPSVAVIVPAYNEENVIVRTIESVLGSSYRWPFEIVVVDDGSKDQTFKRAEEAYGKHPKVRCLTKENGGKGEAINFGMRHTDAEYVIVIDADTLFDADTVPLLVRHFTDPKVAAVSGNVKVGNRINLLTRMQAFEYVSGQNLDRRAYDALQSNTVVPGAVGAWKKSVVLEEKGFSSDTLAEDSDLTVTLLRAGWRVVHENDAHAYTEAPEDWKTFSKQRFRWTFGILQVAIKHADAIFDSKASPALRFFVLPHTILSQTLFPAVAPIADLATFVALILLVGDQFFPGIVPAMGGVGHVLGYVAVFLLMDFVTAVLAFSFEKGEDWRLLAIAPIQRLAYRFFMHKIYLRSLWTAASGKLATGRLVGWDTFDRTNTAKASVK